MHVKCQLDKSQIEALTTLKHTVSYIGSCTAHSSSHHNTLLHSYRVLLICKYVYLCIVLLSLVISVDQVKWLSWFTEVCGGRNQRLWFVISWVDQVKWLSKFNKV